MPIPIELGSARATRAPRAHTENSRYYQSTKWASVQAGRGIGGSSKAGASLPGRMSMCVITLRRYRRLFAVLFQMTSALSTFSAFSSRHQQHQYHHHHYYHPNRSTSSSRELLIFLSFYYLCVFSMFRFVSFRFVLFGFRTLF